MTNVRPARVEDGDAIGALAERAGLFPADLAGEMMAPFVSGEGDGLWLAADEQDVLVGFAYTAPEKLTHGTHNMLAMAVDDAQRSSGIGSALVAETERLLAQCGGRILIVETSSLPAFKPTIAFYAKRGFEQEARIRDYWAAGDDKLVFRKMIG